MEPKPRMAPRAPIADGHADSASGALATLVAGTKQLEGKRGVPRDIHARKWSTVRAKRQTSTAMLSPEESRKKMTSRYGVAISFDLLGDWHGARRLRDQAANRRTSTSAPRDTACSAMDRTRAAIASSR